MKHTALLISFFLYLVKLTGQSHYYPPVNDLEKKELTGNVKKVTHYQFYQQDEIPGYIEYFNTSGYITHTEVKMTGTWHFYFYGAVAHPDTLIRLAKTYGPCYISFIYEQPGSKKDTTCMLNENGEKIDSSISTSTWKINEDGTYQSALFKDKYPGPGSYTMLCSYTYYKEQKKVMMTISYPGADIGGIIQVFYFKELNKNPEKMMYAEDDKASTRHFEYDVYDHCIKEVYEENGEKRTAALYVYQYDAAGNWITKKTMNEKGVVYEYFRREIEYY